MSFFVVSRWPKSSFWYRDLFFGIEILHSVVQHLDRLLPGINPCALLGPRHPVKWRSRRISIPKRRSKNLDTPKKTSRYPLKESPKNIFWEFPDLVVLNLVVCNFYAEALFCALLRIFLQTCVCSLLRSFACICVFLRPTAFRTNAFGNCIKYFGKTAEHF